ncbi:CBO0543 family protein [Niallia sp. FSL R7-0648]|uniref:CBO0543 family protein n=1 Tax=Niallia sp. FSL R7-0648 TaxID=2954521 RepID=UPI0030F55A37
MNMERWILVGIIVISILAIFLLVPKQKTREAWVIFLSLQIITWPAGLLAVEWNMIDYPVQLFSSANKFNRSSFTFEFFLFPVTAIMFSLYFPKKLKKTGKFFYYFLFAGFFTCLEVVIERYTELVDYLSWHGSYTLLSVMVTLYINHTYYSWFKKELKKNE